MRITVEMQFLFLTNQNISQARHVPATSAYRFQAKSKTVLHLAELRRSWWWAALLEQFVDMGRAPWSYPVGGYWWNTVESYRIMSVNLMKFTEISQDTKQLLKGTPKQLPQVSINAPSTSSLLFKTVSAVASTDALHIFFIWGFP